MQPKDEPPKATDVLQDYRKAQHERFIENLEKEKEQRQLEETQERLKLEETDWQLAKQLQEQEDREASAQLLEHPPSQSIHPTTANTFDHPLIDGSLNNEDGVRPALRTGYSERLLDPSPPLSRFMQHLSGSSMNQESRGSTPQWYSTHSPAPNRFENLSGPDSARSRQDDYAATYSRAINRDRRNLLARSRNRPGFTYGFQMLRQHCLLAVSVLLGVILSFILIYTSNR